jgi:lysophospholipase L1-like esterase
LKNAKARPRRLSAGLATLIGLSVAAAGVGGYAVYRSTEPSAEAAAQAAAFKPSKATIAAAPDLPAMAIVGDSFASTGSDDWGPRTARCAGYFPYISGARSSGFLNPGISQPYGGADRMEAVTAEIPKVVIFESAYNDARFAETRPEKVQQAAIDTINAYKKVAPDAKYVILGPFPTERFKGPDITNNVAALQAAAAATGATHILPSADWMPGLDYLKDDLSHPNAKGNRYLASKLLVALRDAKVITSTGGCEKLPA